MDLSGAILKIIPNAEYIIIGNDYNRLKWSEESIIEFPNCSH